MTRDSSRDAEPDGCERVTAGERGTEPPPSSQRTRPARGSERRTSVVIAASVVMAPDDSDLPPGSANMTMEAWAAMHGDSAPGAHDECSRMRLIGELTRLLHDTSMPENTRAAGLTLIGWLARRMPGEAPHALGVPRCPPADPDARRQGGGARPALTPVSERRPGRR